MIKGYQVNPKTAVVCECDNRKWAYVTGDNTALCFYSNELIGKEDDFFIFGSAFTFGLRWYIKNSDLKTLP